MARINKLNIKNFRGIKEVTLELDKLNIFIGDNGTNKTNVMEAIHYALSPSFLSGRLKYTDFHEGCDDAIKINVEFDQELNVNLPDGYQKQNIKCNKVSLEIKKRDRKTAGKILSDFVTINHIVEPNFDPSIDNENGKNWEIKRKSGKIFRFNERLLSFGVFETEDLPRSFYFSIDREKQLQRGYNTSFSSIIEDFNWRYAKALRKEENNNKKNELFNSINTIQDQIINLIDITDHDVMKEFNKRVNEFGLDNVKLSILNKLYPYEQSYLSKEVGDLNLHLKNLGSGIEMIYSIILLETLASLSKEKLVIFIDEPELHLHPLLQEKFALYLYKLSKDEKYQITITTHSPLFFKTLIGKEGVKPFIFNNGKTNFVKSYAQEGLFPWSPSWGEINYFAYNYPTLEFFNELYGYLMDLTECGSCNEFDDYLNSQWSIKKNKIWIKERIQGAQDEEQVTIITFIRHKIHHPENKTMQNSNYSEDEFKEAIDKMIGMIEIIKIIE